MFAPIFQSSRFGRLTTLGLFLSAVSGMAGVAEPLRAAQPVPATPALLSAPGQPGPVAEPASPAVFRARPGPWGDLEYFTVYLEPSKAILKEMDLLTYDTVWKFVGHTEDQVGKLFESVQLPPEIAAELLDRKKWRRDGKIISVFPGDGTLLGLPRAARATIYQVLGQWEENNFQLEPACVSGHDVRAWLRREELPEQILSVIEKTVYTRGQNLVFADLPLILRMVRTEDERLKIRKALSRTATLVVKLRLNPQTDVAAIANYWGGYTRSKDVLPFLESISQVPGADLVDLIHLLPTGVRGLLYTFPNLNHGQTGFYPDCHWTSLNFGNAEPILRLAAPTTATAYTLENYARMAPGEPTRFGDILFFMNGTTGSAIHSCVYLADDIVYTKNGRSPTQPWVLMKLGDVLSLYAMYYQPQIVSYRRKSE